MGKDLVAALMYVISKTEDDSGLEVSLKKGIKGKLPADDTYMVTDFEKVPPGESLKICDNCGKGIRHVCHLNGNEHIVGPDCAITLVEGPQQKKVEDYIKTEKNRSAFVRRKMKDLGENFTEEPTGNIDKWYAVLRKEGKKNTLNNFLQYGFHKFIKDGNIVEAYRFFALDAIYAKAKTDKPKEWKAALEKAYEDKAKTRSKTYWYGTVRDRPDFYEDNEELFKQYGNTDLSNYFDWRAGA